MLPAGQSIADEIEAAIGGSTAKCIETARRVTDLFLASAGHYDSEQIELFNSVLERLVKAIELRSIVDISARMALADMSAQLAPIAQAPPTVIRQLAGNDEISIAAPVLQESARLGDDDLIEIAQSKSEPHLLAISGRWWLKEAVTDALLSRRFPSVSRRVVGNPGARISAGGFAIIVTQAEKNPDLAVEAGIRVDLPSELRQQLLNKASEAVRTKLLSRAPPHLFEEIRSAIATATASADREMSRVRDFAAARQFVAKLNKKGELDEAVLAGFARQKKYEETVVALAELSNTTIEVIRPLMQSLRDDGLLVACRAAELGWETTAAVLECRYSTGSMDAVELARAKSHFAAMTTENARRMLMFWQVRSIAPARVN
ncbi:MAG TPA: DUF2336 domain-containing protein [Bradyrhizobium sp.]